MTKKLKASIVMAAAVMMIYLVSGSNQSLAEIGSAATVDIKPDSTISLVACLVRVDIEDLEQSTDDSGFSALSSISAGHILKGVEADMAEVISNVKLLVSGGCVGEVTADQKADEKNKDRAKEAGEYFELQTTSSFHAEVIEIQGGKISVEYVFKQLINEHESSEESEAEHEGKDVYIFEASSTFSLALGKPVIASATKSEDGAMFLILYADI